MVRLIHVNVMRKDYYMNGLLLILRLLLSLFARSVVSSPEKAPSPSQMPLETPQAATNHIYEPFFKNDSGRLRDELQALKAKNHDLYLIMYDITTYCATEFKKDVVITMIYRTEAEQDSIYKDDPKYIAKKFKSPHQLNHAFDLRSSTFDTKQIEKLVLWLNTTYNVHNYYNWTAKCHDIGLGDHFHVQFCKK